jgi:hypothetical protein
MLRVSTPLEADTATSSALAAILDILDIGRLLAVRFAEARTLAGGKGRRRPVPLVVLLLPEVLPRGVSMMYDVPLVYAPVVRALYGEGSPFQVLALRVL